MKWPQTICTLETAANARENVLCFKYMTYTKKRKMVLQIESVIMPWLDVWACKGAVNLFYPTRQLKQ